MAPEWDLLTQKEQDMATKRYRIGTKGPYTYNDGFVFKDAVTAKALITDHVIEAAGVPTDDNDLTRKIDLEEAVALAASDIKRWAYILG